MNRRRASLDHDPLDLVLGAPLRATREDAVPPGRKTRATFHLPVSLVEEARNATVALSGPPIRLTLARLVEDGLRREVERLREQHNAGEPFPTRSAELVGGRPIRA